MVVPQIAGQAGVQGGGGGTYQPRQQLRWRPWWFAVVLSVQRGWSMGGDRR